MITHSTSLTEAFDGKFGKNEMLKMTEFAGVVRRVGSLRGRMGEAGRQVNGLFESLLAEAFV